MMMQSDKLPKNLVYLIALVITFIGFVLRIYNIGGESLWYDELLQVNIANADLASMLRRLPFHAAVPLDYVISHFWIRLGTGDGWVRIPAAVAGTLTLPVVFQLGRRMLGNHQALLLMALVTYAPFHVRFSQEVRPYALGVLGVTLFSYFTWRLRETGSWRYLPGMMIAAPIFALSHFFSDSIFGVWLLFLGIDWLLGPQRAKSLKAMSGVIASGLVAMLILLFLGWGPTLNNVSAGVSETIVNPEQLTADPDEKPNFGTGPQVNEYFIRTQILAPLGAGAGANSLWLFNGLAVLGVISLILQHRGKLGLLLALWTLLPIVGIVFFLVHRGTFFAARYIIWVLPGYLALVTAGILAVPHWIRQVGPIWLAAAIFILMGGAVLADQNQDLWRWYNNKDKEDWRLVGDFITSNASPDDAVIAVKAEPVMNWYYPPATTDGNFYSDFEVIKSTVAKADRSWVILSIFSSGIDQNIKVWLGDGEMGAIRFVLDPIISVYYLGQNASKDQLLEEIQSFALPKDHALYASLARENRRNPEIARQYYQLAMEYAPDDATRATYQASLEALIR